MPFDIDDYLENIRTQFNTSLYPCGYSHVQLLKLILGLTEDNSDNDLRAIHQAFNLALKNYLNAYSVFLKVKNKKNLKTVGIELQELQDFLNCLLKYITVTDKQKMDDFALCHLSPNQIRFKNATAALANATTILNQLPESGNTSTYEQLSENQKVATCINNLARIGKQIQATEYDKKALQFSNAIKKIAVVILFTVFVASLLASPLGLGVLGITGTAAFGGLIAWTFCGTILSGFSIILAANSSLNIPRLIAAETDERIIFRLAKHTATFYSTKPSAAHQPTVSYPKPHR